MIDAHDGPAPDAGAKPGMATHLPETFVRRFLLTLAFVLVLLPAHANERWQILPPTPAAIPSDRTGQAPVNGISLHYAMYGHGSPVIFLHGAWPTPTTGAFRCPPSPPIIPSS